MARREAAVPINLRRKITAERRASLFRNGANQAVRLPQDMRFPEGVDEVVIRREGNNLVLSAAKPEWKDFFALTTVVPDDFLADRNDPPPQKRRLL